MVLVGRPGAAPYPITYTLVRQRREHGALYRFQLLLAGNAQLLENAEDALLAKLVCDTRQCGRRNRLEQAKGGAAHATHVLAGLTLVLARPDGARQGSLELDADPLFLLLWCR